MYTIGKTFTFAAAHHLPLLAEGHKCQRVHGHNYTVTLELSFDALDEHGFVLDYGDMAPFGAFLQEVLDHRDLNVVLAEENLVGPALQPTAEVLAHWLWGLAHVMFEQVQVTAVRVCETPTTFAEYRP